MIQHEVYFIAHPDSPSADVTHVLQSYAIPTQRLYLDEAKAEEWDKHWERVALIDIREAVDEGFDLALHIKRLNAALPIIMIAHPNFRTLTTIAKARITGAESIWLPPHSAASDLLTMLRGAARKLDHWRVLLNRLDAESHHPGQRLPVSPFTPTSPDNPIRL